MAHVHRYLNRHTLFEIAPGFIFLAVSDLWGLRWATAALVFATLLFSAISITRDRRLVVFPIIAVILVLTLGGLSLLVGNELFIKIKPTVGKCLFAATLLAGLFFRPCLLARALTGQVHLTDEGWRVLTIRWALLALALAGMNELVWRTRGTDAWVLFSAWLTPASILGYILITRHTAPRYWSEPDNQSEDLNSTEPSPHPVD